MMAQRNRKQIDNSRTNHNITSKSAYAGGKKPWISPFVPEEFRLFFSWNNASQSLKCCCNSGR